jgi:hypothetical protein
MASTRRKISSGDLSTGKAIPNGATPPSVSTDPQTAKRTATTTAQRSPFLPTRLEAILIAIYPTTLLLGSLFSALSNSTRNAPYNPVLQSHPPEFAPSYFAQKKNIFNVFFVKIGWFWTTAAFVVFLLTHPSLGPPLFPTITARRARAIARYLAVTAAWFLTTQWFFGPPLIDRGFRITGGACEILLDPEKVAEMSRPKEYLTAAACKAAKGTWRGGYDISGHVFLLILGSAFLWLEILPAVTRSEGLRDGRSVKLADGIVKTAVAIKTESAADKRKKGEVQQTGGDPNDQVTKWGVKLVIGVAALMWWMLLMTAAFFHTWVEKFSGLLVAFAAVYAVYFLPRGVPELRTILGMPGL